MQFLKNRFEGVPFSKASGYDQAIKKYDHSKHSEKEIEKFKAKLNIIPFKTIGGNGLVDKVKGFFKPKKGKRSILQRLQDFKNQKQRLDLPPSIRALPNLDSQIVELVVAREPVSGIITKLGDWLSKGKLGKNTKRMHYDDIFHLYFIIRIKNAENKPLKLEKNHVINLNIVKKFSKDMVIMPVKGIQDDLTLNKLFKGGLDLVGPKKLYIYDPVSANCQWFLKWMLEAQNLMTPELKDFIMQDATELTEGIEGLASKAKTVPSFAGSLDYFMRGAKK
jgi:hypothetical protein